MRRESGEQLLNDHFLSYWTSDVNKVITSRRVEVVTSLSVCVFVCPRNIQPEMSKLGKECTLSYLLSDRFMTFKVWKKTKAFVQIKAPVFLGSNLFFTSIKSNGQLPGT